MKRVIGWPKYKPVSSPENRIGQAWKPGEIQVIGEDEGGNAKIFSLPDGNYKCSCGSVVTVYKNAVAACEGCGEIYSDPSTPEGRMSRKEQKRRVERHKYECVHKEPGVGVPPDGQLPSMN